MTIAAGELLLPVGTGNAPAFAQTFDRRLCTGTVNAPATGVITLTAIWLPQGQKVTGITFVSGSTAESGGSHLWHALYKGNVPIGATVYTLMAQGADDTGATSFGANAAYRQALQTVQTCPYTGVYYLGFMCVGTIPTLQNITGSVNGNGNITGMTPLLSFTADGSLTTTAPTSLGATTAVTQSYYAFVD